LTALTVAGKVYEYAAMRKPVVASRLPTVERDLPGDAARTYPSGDADAMAAAIPTTITDARISHPICMSAGTAALMPKDYTDAARFVACVARCPKERANVNFSLTIRAIVWHAY